MIVEPKIKGFICTTAHPKGCEKNILNNIEYFDAQKKLEIPKVKNALVIGCSAGYGLASALAASFALGAGVVGVAFEKNAQKDRGRTATAGMYNLAAYQKEANKRGLYLKTIIGDAFAHETKQKVCEVFKDAGKKIDMLIYSIAAPARLDPDTGERYSSVLKPIGKEYRSKGVDLSGWKINETAVGPATVEEIKNTVKVMGGEDLEIWAGVLAKNNLLSENAAILSYTYIGPPLTHEIYQNGTVGAAKNHLKATSDKLNGLYGVCSYVSVNKAVVTQSSAAIPVLPLYISILFSVMKQKKLHENCAQQIYRMFEKFRAEKNLTDENGFIRMDDLEMQDPVQAEVKRRWDLADDENLTGLADLEGYKRDFLNLFGFGLDGVDYGADAEIEVDENSLGIINLL
ncbi:MAG: enoyl-[acyl-carrier-protein] reductase FabV [Oscillospiraceae bacterium]|nr:enoyl-[acyl-carrier-protein] reductase FabV [Oscillospiraceae bacterium]